MRKQNSWLGADFDEGQLAFGRQVGDDAFDFIFGGGKTGGRNVRCQHGCGGIQHDDHFGVTDRVAGQGGAQQGENQRRQDQQLHEKQQVAAQLLPGYVRLTVFDQHLPEQRGGDLDLLPPQFEHVKQQDGDGEESEEGEEGGEEGHRFAPLRIACCALRNGCVSGGVFTQYALRNIPARKKSSL